MAYGIRSIPLHEHPERGGGGRGGPGDGSGRGVTGWDIGRLTLEFYVS